MFVRNHASGTIAVGGIGATRDRAAGARMRHRIVARVPLKIFLYFGTKRFVALAGLGQGQFNQAHRKWSLEHGFIRENEHPLDLPFGLGF